MRLPNDFCHRLLVRERPHADAVTQKVWDGLHDDREFAMLGELLIAASESRGSLTAGDRAEALLIPALRATHDGLRRRQLT